MVAEDKKQFKKEMREGDASPNDLQPLSPPVVHSTSNPLFPNPSPHRHQRNVSGSDQEDQGPVLCDSINRKMLFNLSTLLNTAFPDYDFSDVRGDDFSLSSDLEGVIRSVGMYLKPVSQVYGQIQTDLWKTVDQEIQLKQCLLYSYNPDYSSDPFGEDGCLWSFNHFFYNKRLKRILFFSCRALSTTVNYSENSELLDEEEEEPMWDME